MDGDPRAEYIARYSNWSRWGDGDELGTANLIDAAKIRDAARRVRHGRPISLSLPLDEHGPQTGALRRANCVRYSTATGTDHLAGTQLEHGTPMPGGFGYADDAVILPLHAATHWDSLAHIFHEGHMYNGRSAAEVSASGAAHCGAEVLRDRLIGRAVLLDLPASQGREWLEDGHAITAEELDAAAEFGRVEIEPGDMVLLHTGQMKRCRRHGWGEYAGGGAPGLSFFTIPWLADHGVAAIAGDTWGVEVRPNELPASHQPFHLVAIVYMGLLLGEMFDLERLAETCAEERRYEVFLHAAPLPVTGGTGGPCAPVALL